MNDVLALFLCAVCVPLTLFAVFIFLEARKWSAIILFVLLLIVEVLALAEYSRADTRVVRCKAIERIDTVYRNDSIIAYEITIREDD